MALRTLDKILLNNNWRSSTILENGDSLNLMKSNIFNRNVTSQTEAMVNGFDYDNIQDTITTGLVNYENKQQNLPDSINKPNAVPIESKYDDLRIKIYYGNQWWKWNVIEKDVMSSNDPELRLAKFMSKFWAWQWNSITSAMVTNLSGVAEITVGGTGASAEYLSEELVLKVRAKKEDMGFGKLNKIYTNSKTITAILKKQYTTANAPNLITEVYRGNITQTPDGQNVTTTPGAYENVSYMYKGVVPIILDDMMPDGILSFVEDGAFLFHLKNTEKPFYKEESAMANIGAGVKNIGMKMIYIIHPIGFNFTGTYHATSGAPATYASRSGMTPDELKNLGPNTGTAAAPIYKSMYKLAIPAKKSPIYNLRVKNYLKWYL